jgi:hypothetical protein
VVQPVPGCRRSPTGIAPAPQEAASAPAIR